MEKEVLKLFWVMKGHIPSHFTKKDIKEIEERYFKSVWYNEEAYVHMEGFEEAYQEFLNKRKKKKSGIHYKVDIECDCPRQIKYTIVRDVTDVPVACPFCKKVIV